MNNLKLNKIPDCKIYFPNKGLVGDVETSYRSKPKFIIVPKEKYVKMHPEYTQSKRSSPTRINSAKQRKGGNINEYSNNHSRAEYSNIRREPQRKIVERYQTRPQSKYVIREKLTNIGRLLNVKKNSRLLRQSLRNKMNNKPNYIFDSLVKKKGKYLDFQQKKNSMKIGNLKYNLDSSVGGFTGKSKNINIRLKAEKPSYISSGYGDITKIINRK